MRKKVQFLPVSFLNVNAKLILTNACIFLKCCFFVVVVFFK